MPGNDELGKLQSPWGNGHNMTETLRTRSEKSAFKDLLGAPRDYFLTAKRILEEDPAARSLPEVLICYPGLKAVFFHRFSHFLFSEKFFFLARLFSQWSRFFTGIEIHPGALIGKKVFMDHGNGIVIGETTEIGDESLIYHGVTLGGVSRQKVKRHPTLGKRVIIGAGATILGPVNIGDGAKIASGAVIIEDLGQGMTVSLAHTKTDISALNERAK